jgi:hypothetical protein
VVRWREGACWRGRRGRHFEKGVRGRGREVALVGAWVLIWAIAETLLHGRNVELRNAYDEVEAREALSSSHVTTI